jgi:hypothetical protein
MILLTLLLVLVGVLLFHFGCRTIVRIDQPKNNRMFRSWLSERLNRDDAHGSRTANGVIFSLGMCLTGVALVLAGSAYLFKRLL